MQSWSSVDLSTPRKVHRLAGFCFSRVVVFLSFIGRNALPGWLGLHPGLDQCGFADPDQDALLLAARMRF